MGKNSLISPVQHPKEEAELFVGPFKCVLEKLRCEGSFTSTLNALLRTNRSKLNLFEPDAKSPGGLFLGDG